MKKAIVWMLMLLLCVTAQAESSDPALEYQQILKRTEAIGLEMQILDLQLELAALQGNAEETERIQQKKKSLQDEQDVMEERKIDLTIELYDLCMAQYRSLEQEYAALQTRMDEVILEMEDLQDRMEDGRNTLRSHVIETGLHIGANGFSSNLNIYMLQDEDGAIKYLEVDASGETKGFGTRVGEDPAFVRQFIGKAGPFAIGEDVDVLSGATVTSKAVIHAINLMYDHHVLNGWTKHEVSNKGLLSRVLVTVYLDENKAVADVVVDCSGETEAIAGPCAKEPFLSQFIGLTEPNYDADIVSGATHTSNAVIESVNYVLESYGGEWTPWQ